MISLCKVHDPKKFWFARAYPTKHFSYVRNRPARIRSTIIQSSIVNTHTKSITRFRNELNLAIVWRSGLSDDSLS